MNDDELIAALAAGDDAALAGPWAWPVRPAADRGAWICASVVFAVGLLLFTIRGPRTRLSDNG